jgi:hypothetical protein
VPSSVFHKVMESVGHCFRFKRGNICVDDLGGNHGSFPVNGVDDQKWFGENFSFGDLGYWTASG